MENSIFPSSQGGDDDLLALQNFLFDTSQDDGCEKTLQDRGFQTTSTQREYPYPTRSPLNIHNTSPPTVFEDGTYNHLPPHRVHAQQNEDRFDHIQGSFLNTHQPTNPLGNPQQMLRMDRDHVNMMGVQPAQNTYVHQQGFNPNHDYMIGYRQQPLQPNSHPLSEFNSIPNHQYRLQQGPQQITSPHHPHHLGRQGSLGSFTTSTSPCVSVDQNLQSYRTNVSNSQNEGMRPTIQWKALHNPTIAQQRMMAQDSLAFELQTPDAGTSKRQRIATKPQEPDHLVGKDIPCQHCPSIDTTFKYFCNKKVTQPRYFCNTCKKYFTYNGKKYKKLKGTSGLKAFTCKPSSNKYGTRKRKMDFEETEATTSDSSMENENLESLYQFKRTGPNPYNLRRRVTSIEEHETRNSEGIEDTSENIEDRKENEPRGGTRTT
jgi:hypothetical protein